MKKLTRNQMAARVAKDILPGSYVNIGIGLPELVANHLDPADEILLHSENGMIGMGPEPASGEANPELINAGKRPVTLLTGGAFFGHVDSFAMMRGGHLDLCIMGAMQVSQAGDLANWSLGRKGEPPAVGGAMDLSVGARKVFILMEHNAKDGTPKLVENCSLPLTGLGVVHRIYTDLAIIEITSEGFFLREKLVEISDDELQRCTGAKVHFPKTR
ncbi:3-oxoadipate CoA-transferase [Bordetella trematum]|uniref:3-oxoadipate CoA-transferase subunit B n=1 Tax=Bordetella trematum TaxID=123899 RepID=A0A157K745_9BORD|nr:3-oxoacid CoA-transferase subunit B [Bordetella trematum]AZR94076.1 3-oxoadipate CoA-transferase [Bordetella trematum]NNH18448.1 3-oxoacid CoA-transferase subunit B [Bordetella trematum]QIM72611.1 3-oxoacid CoA-transferase subunit B [Bordetella trematum]SAH80302.1 3-oxoadipate CoA-transferase subunit B [Bordetella trematum]SAI07737.1 3-oxoadipate CoA-transferase subunit B [Bordetella trematum]